MNESLYSRTRVFTTIFVASIVLLAVIKQSYGLAIIGVICGLLILQIAKRKSNIVNDERQQFIQEKAAKATYAIFAPTIGLGSLLLILFSSRDRYYFLFLEPVGHILAYLTCFLIVLYALSYFFFSKKY